MFQEIWGRLGHTPNIHFYDTTDELVAMLRPPPVWVETPQIAADDGALRSAREIRAALDRALQAASYTRIVERIRAVQLTSAFLHDGSRPVSIDTEAARAARFLAARVETAARRVLGMQLVYQATRIAFRGDARGGAVVA